jgi:NADPH-dependent ferric siderophore reductase
MTHHEPRRPVRARREPPRFRTVEVARVEALSPRLVGITFSGPELGGLVVDEPAASVRLLLPPVGTQELVMPAWNGNEFLLRDGTRPVLRTFTPRRYDPDTHELLLQVVLHGHGAASSWAAAVVPGAPAAISGPGRGYAVDAGMRAVFLAGDETALPAMSQLLETLPAGCAIGMHVEIGAPEARIRLPERVGAAVEWHVLPAGAAPGDALVATVRSAGLTPDVHVWAAGEAASVQAIRRHLFGDRGVPRAQTSIRGYWKRGRTGDGPDGA